MLQFEGGSVAREGSPERLVDIMAGNPAELNHEVAAVRSGTPHIVACHHICQRQSSLNNPRDNTFQDHYEVQSNDFVTCTQYSIRCNSFVVCSLYTQCSVLFNSTENAMPSVDSW